MRQNFASRSRSKKRTRRPRSPSTSSRFRACWATQAPKPQELALDSLVAPARVLLGEADDQLLHVLVERRSSWSATRVGPRAGDQPPVPAQQRLWGDQEAGPAGPGQRAADRGKQGAVGRLQLGSWNLAAEHGELLAQHQDLQVLGGVATGEQREELDGAAQREVGEFRQHQVAPVVG